MAERSVEREVELRGMSFFAAVDFVAATVVSIECERHEIIAEFPSLTGEKERYVAVLRACCDSLLDRLQDALAERSPAG